MNVYIHFCDLVMSGTIEIIYLNFYRSCLGLVYVVFVCVCLFDSIFALVYFIIGLWVFV
jgi:hypothetical protein